MTERTWKRGIALDFDGVIHDYSGGWTGHVPEGGPVPGALEFVQEMLAQGWEVSIFTCRALPEDETLDSPWAKHAERIGAVREWLVRYGFPGEVNLTGHKPHAEIYVDDRAFRFQGCWNAVRAALDVKPWQHPEAVKPTPALEASLKMDLATAVAVLNREKHNQRRWFTIRYGEELVVEWESCEAGRVLTPYEAIAIATAYEQDRLAQGKEQESAPPAADADAAGSWWEQFDQVWSAKIEGTVAQDYAEDPRSAAEFREFMVGMGAAFKGFLQDIETQMNQQATAWLIRELEAIQEKAPQDSRFPSSSAYDRVIRDRLSELRSQDGA